MGDLADVKLSNVDKKVTEGEREVKLCNYTDVYKSTFINSEKAVNFMIASCTENEYEKFVLRRGQVAITKDSEKKDDIGISAYISQDFDDVVLGYHLALITPKDDKLDGCFLNYWFNTSQAKRYFENNAGGSGQRFTLPLEIIKGIKIYLPDLPTQRKIASVLTALDHKIELNNKINAELEAMAKTLYDYWFVQFEFPFDFVQGKLNAEGKPYKSSGGKMVYNETLKREIPEGWEVTVFNDWIETTKAGDWGREEIQDNYTERVVCIRGTDINGLNGKGELKAPIRYILRNNLTKSLEPFDFIIEISGGSPTQSTARIGMITEEALQRFDAHIVCSNFCKAVTLKDKHYAFIFLREWQRLYDAAIFFGFEGKTSGIRNFLFDSFMQSYYVVKPPKELAIQYFNIARDIEKKRQSNLKQNHGLAALRDWLLPMLMSGQVKVKDVEEKVVKLEAVDWKNVGSRPSTSFV